MFRIEHNVETGEIIEIELTAEEKAELQLQYEKSKAEAKAIKAEADAKEVARQALLDKLGITAEEAQLLLGGK
jgi:hypothetical protein